MPKRDALHLHVEMQVPVEAPVRGAVEPSTLCVILEAVNAGLDLYVGKRIEAQPHGAIGTRGWLLKQQERVEHPEGLDPVAVAAVDVREAAQARRLR